jgi:hypothetical protein
MKKIQVFIALFISVLVFSCQDNSNQISPNGGNNRKAPTSVNSINQDVTACNPTYPSINGTALYDYHLAVSLYRAFANIYGDYKLRKQSNPNAVVNGTTLSALGWGMIPATSMGVTATSPGWPNVTSFISTGLTALSATAKNQVITKADAWNTSGTYGSYTITFLAGTVYCGKGGGVTRCNQSANERCSATPQIAEYQNSGTGYYIVFGSGTTDERQAFKEEAVRMYKGGFGTSSNNTLNTIQSPGVGYINADGY